MKRFCTERLTNEGVFAGYVDAVDWEHAEAIVSRRDERERVVGVLYAIVAAEHWSDEDADRFARAIADMNEEPPDAVEFGDVA